MTYSQGVKVKRKKVKPSGDRITRFRELEKREGRWKQVSAGPRGSTRPLLGGVASFTSRHSSQRLRVSPRCASGASSICASSFALVCYECFFVDLPCSAPATC